MLPCPHSMIHDLTPELQLVSAPSATLIVELTTYVPSTHWGTAPLKAGETLTEWVQFEIVCPVCSSPPCH